MQESGVDTAQGTNTALEHTVKEWKLTQELNKSAEFKHLPQALQRYILQLAIEIAVRTPGSVDAAVDVATRMAEGLVEEARTDIAHHKEEARIKEKLLELQDTYTHLTPEELRRVKEIDQRLNELDKEESLLETVIEKKTEELNEKSLQDFGKKISEITADEFKKFFDNIEEEEERKKKAREYLPPLEELRQAHEIIVKTLEEGAELLVERGVILHQLTEKTLKGQIEEVKERHQNGQGNILLQKHYSALTRQDEKLEKGYEQVRQLTEKVEMVREQVGVVREATRTEVLEKELERQEENAKEILLCEAICPACDIDFDKIGKNPEQVLKILTTEWANHPEWQENNAITMVRDMLERKFPQTAQTARETPPPAQEKEQEDPRAEPNWRESPWKERNITPNGPDTSKSWQR